MAKSGGADGIRANKRLKLEEEKEDRLSALPDSIIQHILSFLPSTKEAIRACVLSKRWRHQWTRVPNLIFEFTGNFSDESIATTTSYASRIIDNALIFHDCNKIKKFHIIAKDSYYYDCIYDPNYDAKLHYAIRKQAEDISLRFWTEDEKFRLPSFFFRQACLVKLYLCSCSIRPMGMVYWESLKDLNLECCSFSDKMFESIVSGSPMLRTLEMDYGSQYGTLVISSKSLKRLVLLNSDNYLEISCPNLVEFDFMSHQFETFGRGDKVLERFLSGSPLLEFLELDNCEFPKVRIALKNVKKLCLRSVECHEIEISCPCLEELDLSGLDTETIRLMDLPSSIRAALDFDTYQYGSKMCEENVAKQIIEQLQHLDELRLGSSFVGTLSALEMEGISYPLLKGESLTLEDPSCAHLPGIVCALRSSPALERLVIKFQPHKSQKLADLSDMDNSGANYWESNGTRFSSLVSHLRKVKIIGLSQRDDKPKLILDFVEFLLKKASVLEKIVGVVS